MNNLFANDPGRTGWFDHLLSTVAGVLVLYSLGNAISRPEVGTTMLTIYIIGRGFSWVFGSLAWRTRIVRWDGAAYVFAVTLLIFTFSNVTSLIPDNPFIGIFSSAGFLGWMLIFGAFTSWRDGTILFQAVPCIAIFGLVGCYDTYRPVTYMFFAFLLCVATLFARINARNMLEFAVRSGASIARQSDAETSMASLRRGPWRSVAGPTWALLSAGIIVLLSFLGAPIVQASVQSVVGHLRLPLPSNFNRLNLGNGFFRTDRDTVQIGQGPVALASEPVLRIRMDQPRYLRSGIFYRYGGHGWRQTSVAGSDAAAQERIALRDMLTATREEIKKPKTIDFQIEMLTARGGTLPVPGEVITIDHSPDVKSNPDGTFTLEPTAILNAPSHGEAIVARSSRGQPVSAQTELPPEISSLYLDISNIPPPVVQLAEEVTKGAKSDWERANRIRVEVSNRITYDQNAPPVPEDRDAVDFTLFQSRRGYCDLFASSMVLMARSVHLPARYVTGFYPFDNRQDEGGRYVVRERDAHAWAEIYFKDYGWVVFDATIGAAEADGGSRKDEGSGAGWIRSSVGQWSLRVGSASIGLAAMFLVFRRRVSSTSRDRNRDRLSRIYSRFNQDLYKRSGRARLPEETPEEYLLSIEGLLGPLSNQANEINSTFLIRFFGREPTSSEQLNDLVSRVRNLERMPKSSQ